MIPPSPWLVRHIERLPKNGDILDLACGNGRHARLLIGQNHRVLAVDRDALALAALVGLPNLEILQADLEGEVWPLAGRTFSGIVVTNYLWRPRLPELLNALLPGGLLIYETFMLGNDAYGKPSNPDFLLLPEELREHCKLAGLQEIEYREGYVECPKPAMSQAICAIRPL